MRSRVTRMPAAPVAMLGAAVLLVLTGCGGGDKAQQGVSGSASKTASAAKSRVGAAADQTATMVEAPTLGRATAPVRLKFELAQRPVAGQTILVRIALIPGTAAQSMSLQFADSAGLVLADHTERQLGAVHPDTAYQLEISASAPAEGVFFLNLGATLAHDATVETRNFSIPIIVAAS